MKLELGPDLERIIQRRVESGEYETAEAVVEVALRLLDEGDEPELSESELEELRRKIDLGLEDIKQGRVIDGPAVFAALRGKIDQSEGTE